MRTRAVWAMRVLWFLLPVTLGQASSDAIDSASHGVPQVFTIGLWTLWTFAMIASMVPLPKTLTAIRLIAAGSVPLSLWAVFESDVSSVSIVGAAHALVATVVVFNALIGDRFVDGGSYGDERRMLLRPAAQIGFFVVPVLGVLMATALTVGPLLLANKNWIPGVAATVIGAPVVIIGARALDQLTRRWIVFVPSGMVLHDMMVLTEPVLFRRTAIERIGAAITGTPARDLSNRAAGLLLECELTDPAPLGLRDRESANTAELVDVRRFLFCPSRPGELLDEAERRNFAVG